jgi:hypothetical protein
MIIYRVIKNTTQSLQPANTFWTKKVLYCGYDVETARAVYHESVPEDFSQGFGNQVRRTTFDRLDTLNLDDDDPGYDWQSFE